MGGLCAKATPTDIRVIIGPTAAGKSALAMELARRFELAIISADSRQVYRGFDIGTAKPPLSERAEVTHYGIDVQDPRDRYSAHAWAVNALGWMQQVTSGGHDSLIVGGTGFYIRALVSPLAPAPVLDGSRRAAMEVWLSRQPLSELKRWAERLDPARANLGRTQLERAIEVALLSGIRLGDVHAEHRRGALGVGSNSGWTAATDALRVRYLVVDPGVALADRIRARVHAMMDGGWTQEVSALLEEVPVSAPAWLASGYDTMRQHVEGNLTQKAAIERIIIETQQYAKRQRTWCRHQLKGGPVTWISPTDPQATDLAIAWWNGTEGVA